MKKIISTFLLLTISLLYSQEKNTVQKSQKTSNLVVIQDASVDSLIKVKRAYNKGIVTAAETPKDICHPYPKNGLVPGYKIQLDRFKTKAEADKKTAEFSRMYPGIHASVRYETPNYKVYVGNYFTTKKMEYDLRMIRRSFRGAFSVQSKVYVDKSEWNSKYCPSKYRNTSNKE